MRLVSVRYQCDKCGYIAPEGSRLRKTRVNHKYYHWCVSCKPEKAKALPTCEVCGRALRPYNSDARDYPGTLARGSTNPVLCQTHRQDFVSRETLKPRKNPGQLEAARKVKRLLRATGNLDLAPMLGVDLDEEEGRF